MGKEIPEPFDRAHAGIYETFLLDYRDYVNGGEIPAASNADMRYMFRLKKKRLETRKIVPECRVLSRSGKIYSRDWEDGRFFAQVRQLPCVLSQTLKRNGKTVFRNTDDYGFFYETLLDADRNCLSDSDEYSCPNCAAISTLKQLSEGCPYCGTFFRHTDLFPRFSDCRFIRDVSHKYPSDKGGVFKGIMKYYPAGVLLSAVLLSYVQKDTMLSANAGISEHLALFIVSLLEGIFVGFAAALLIWEFCLIVSLLLEVGKGAPFLFGVDGSRKKFEDSLRKQDPNFSYDFFTDKMMRLSEMMLFSEDPELLPVYEGKGEAFGDVVDIEFFGGTLVKKIRAEGNLCYVDSEMMAYVLRDTGRKVRKKKCRIRMQTKRNLQKKQDLSASPLKVQCPCCGGSFNATEIRNCPYCGQKYVNDCSDWTVTSFRVLPVLPDGLLAVLIAAGFVFSLVTGLLPLIVMVGFCALIITVMKNKK